MDYTSIKTQADIRTFLEKTNSLHDGYFISIEYSHKGIQRNKDGGLFIEPYKNELIVKVLVTSMWDITVELRFTGILEQQIRENYGNYIFCVDINFDEHGLIIWSDEKWNPNNQEKMSYVKALNMDWRIVNYYNT